MKIYTCTTFPGFWPVGTAAIVVALGPRTAMQLLLSQLKEHGLETTEDQIELVEVPLDKAQAIILRDGEY